MSKRFWRQIPEAAAKNTESRAPAGGGGPAQGSALSLVRNPCGTITGLKKKLRYTYNAIYVNIKSVNIL